MTIDDKSCTPDKINIVGSGCTIIPNKNHASVIIGGKTSKFQIQRDHDTLVDGVEILGGYSRLTSGGTNTLPEMLWSGAIRGVTILGAGSIVENDNSWQHTPHQNAPFLFQQGILLVGRSSAVSVRNEGTVISGEYLTREISNQGVLIIGKPAEHVAPIDGIETSDTVMQGKYNAHINTGIIIAGHATGYHPYIEFPTLGNSCYGELRGSIHLAESCNIWDKNNKQIVKSGVWQSQ